MTAKSASTAQPVQTAPELPEWAVKRKYIIIGELDNIERSYFCLYGGSRDTIGQYSSSCTGSVYSYNFPVVWGTSAVRYPSYSEIEAHLREYGREGQAASRIPPNPQDFVPWYGVFAQEYHDWDFSVQYLGREGNAEVDLLFCLSPSRHPVQWRSAMPYSDPVLALEHACWNQGEYYGLPHAARGCSSVAGSHGWLTWYVLKKLGAVMPSIRWQGSMPYASNVIAYTLGHVLPHEVLVQCLQATHKFLSTGLSDDSINEVLSAVRELLVQGGCVQDYSEFRFPVQYSSMSNCVANVRVLPHEIFPMINGNQIKF